MELFNAVVVIRAYVAKFVQLSFEGHHQRGLVTHMYFFAATNVSNLFSSHHLEQWDFSPLPTQMPKHN